MKNLVTTIVALAFGSTLGLSGCKKEATCETVAPKIKECVPQAKDESAEELAGECKKMVEKRPDMLKNMGECMDKPCAEFLSCMDKAEEAARKGERLEKISKATAAKDWKDVAYVCDSILEKKTDDDLVKACNELAKAAFADLGAKMTALKTEMKEDKDYQCMTYEKYAAMVSADEGTKAKALCEEVRAAGRAGEQVGEVKKAIETKDFKSASYTCQTALEKKDNPALVKECEAFAKAASESLTADLTKLRDEMKKDEKFSCFDLEKYGKMISEEEGKKAKTLCDELGKADDVAKALAAVAKVKTEGAADADKANVPFECNYTIEGLEKIGTEWAKTQAATLAKACYVELGAVVLEKNATDEEMKYSCNFRAKEVFEGLKKHGLKDPSLDKYLTSEAVKAKCAEFLPQ